MLSSAPATQDSQSQNVTWAEVQKPHLQDTPHPSLHLRSHSCSISNAFPRGTLEYTMNSNHSSHILPFHPPLRFLNIARAILLELKPTPVASLLQRIQWLPSLGKSWVFCGIYMNLRRQELIISLTIHCFLPTVCQSHWPPAGGHTQIHDHLRAFAATFPQPIHPCVSNLTSSGHQPMSTAV